VSRLLIEVVLSRRRDRNDDVTLTQDPISTTSVCVCVCVCVCVVSVRGRIEFGGGELTPSKVVHHLVPPLLGIEHEI
jgi:hypothetical protein